MMARLSDDEAFEVCDVVETSFSGRPTMHIITGRFKVRNSQTGVVYTVAPSVPKSGEGNRIGRLDYAWFKRVGRVYMDNETVRFDDMRDAA